MKDYLLKQGIAQLGIFLTITIVSLLIIFWLANRFIKKKNNFEIYNTSLGIVYFGLVFSTFYLMSGLITPVITTLKIEENNASTWKYIFESSKYISIYLIIILISSFILCLISIKLISYLLKTSSLFDEVKENNIGLSLIISIVLIIFSIMCKDSIQLILEHFVPYPETPNFLN